MLEFLKNKNEEKEKLKNLLQIQKESRFILNRKNPLASHYMSNMVKEIIDELGKDNYQIDYTYKHYNWGKPDKMLIVNKLH